MSERAVQIGFPATLAHRQRLDRIARHLGKSAAAVLRECIDQLWASLPQETQRQLLATGRSR